MTRSRELAELASAYDGGGSLGFRNRIINGDCRIDQRNAGASVTPAAASYLADRWAWSGPAGSKFTFQQVSDAPTGFSNSFKVTVASTYSLGASDYFDFYQKIEGFNTADFNFGSASATSVTLNFWVKSSLTGTFSGALLNSASNRSYPFSFVVNAANTWEQKVVQITGDTSGTWLTNNGTGIQLSFDLGSGASVRGTAGSWSGSALRGSTGANSLVTNLSATLQITGVQLEAGSVATPFERRPYGTELALCERYYQAITDNMRISAMAFNSTVLPATWVFKTTMRAAPTTTATVGSSTILCGGSNLPVASIGGGVSSVYGYSMDVSVASGATAGFGAELRIVGGRVTASAEL